MARRKKFKINYDFGLILMFISILGYFAILVSSLFNYDIMEYVNSLLFLLIGGALLLSGSVQYFFKYFKNGLTKTEVNRIASIVIGGASVVVGIITLPLFGIEADVLDGIKALIAIIAIITIVAERMKNK